MDAFSLQTTRFKKRDVCVCLVLFFYRSEASFTATAQMFVTQCAVHFAASATKRIYRYSLARDARQEQNFHRTTNTLRKQQKRAGASELHLKCVKLLYHTTYSCTSSSSFKSSLTGQPITTGIGGMLTEWVNNPGSDDAQ